MDNASLEMALGMIVFGPMTDSLEGKAFTIDKLREAARMLEYRFAEQRRQGTQAGAITAAAHAEQLGGQQQLAPAKRKRTRGRRAAANGAADHGPGLASPGTDPLFPAEGSVE